MPDWITLIIAFVERYVISITFGLVAFCFSYHYFGEWEGFQKPELFWLMLLLCICIALSVSIFTKRLIKRFLDKRRSLELTKAEQARNEQMWEDSVTNEFSGLSPLTKSALKNSPIPGNTFKAIGQDIRIERLHHFGAVTIIGRTPWGLIFKLTVKGACVIRKRKRDLY